jgi:hypothetical protein
VRAEAERVAREAAEAAGELWEEEGEEEEEGGGEEEDAEEQEEQEGASGGARGPCDYTLQLFLVCLT